MYLKLKAAAAAAAITTINKHKNMQNFY